MYGSPMKTLFVFLGLMFANQSFSAEVKTVPNVDLHLYSGTWNQISYLPTKFQGACTINTTATYTPNTDGTITVENRCEKPNGTKKYIKGYAYEADRATHAKLKVKFFWFAPAADYWVIDLEPNYEFAVVGSPSRQYMWILSRNPVMAKSTYDGILERAKAQGFNVDQLQITGKVE